MCCYLSTGADPGLRDYSGKRAIHYLPKIQAERKIQIYSKTAPERKSLRFPRCFHHSFLRKDAANTANRYFKSLPLNSSSLI